jgi:microcystin-dependent protein
MPAEPFIGEISLVGFNFAASNFHLCDGSLLSIAQNSTLFQLIGTTYGGDGVNSFGLPDLRGRIPVHIGGTAGYVLGGFGGAEQVTLTTGQLPAHAHQFAAGAVAGSSQSPAAAVLATPRDPAYAVPPAGAVAPATVAMGPSAIPAVGGSQGHENMPPFVVMNYQIALFGIFPSQS